MRSILTSASSNGWTLNVARSNIPKRRKKENMMMTKKEKEVQVVEMEEGEDDVLLHSKRVSYVVHPTVYEFITCKSMEDNFITTIDYSQSNVVLTETPHRLSLRFGSATYATTPTSIRLSKVRSLAFMGLMNCMPSLGVFKVVRVMILHIQSDDRDKWLSLAEICELLLLRYLQVRCNITVQLPVQVQCLKHLEALEINARVADVPTDIVHHSSLQHVQIGRKTMRRNLVQGPPSTEPIFDDALSRKSLLLAIQVLELLPPICSFSRLPGWYIEELSSLRILEVVVKEMSMYDLASLGKLPVLTVLSLYVTNPYTNSDKVVTFHRQALFPALEYFKFVSGLLLLKFPEKGMPKVRRIVIRIRFNAHKWEKYSNMLGGIQHLSNLEEVVASIGLATGAEESDRTTAVKACKKVLGEHPNNLIANVRRVDKVDEEYEPPDSSIKWDKQVLNESQNEDSTKQDWYKEMFNQYCELAHDLEDWADRYTLSNSVAVGRRSGTSSILFWWFHRAVNKLMRLPTRPRHVITDDLRDLKVRVQELHWQFVKNNYAVSRASRPLPFERQDKLLHSHPSSLIGHNRPREEVIEMLMNSKDMDEFNIISITGMVGSGKTTLATAVYQQVNGQFDCCASIYMGQQCDMVKALEGMLWQLEMKGHESMGIDELTMKLRGLLMNKRYLIMVDDLRSRKHWGILQSCFPKNNLGSSIIITTMNDALALHCTLGSSDCIYKIDLLSDADSEQLFLNEVLGKGQGFHQCFKDNSAEIMKNCGGLPLAIVSVAAMLEPHQSEDEWRRSRLKLLSNSDKNYMWQRLNLSYNDLPNLLKACMLYLSIFPEHYEVNIECLMRLWIAEGFIIQKGNRTTEETARSYLDGLISRNMVLPLHVNHLQSLNHVLLEFSQVDAGAMATVDTVKNAAATLHHNNPEVTVNVNGRPLSWTIT